MSRRQFAGESNGDLTGWTEDEQQAVEQSLDIQMIEHVKELLCLFWKQDRITIDVRSMGESALGALLEAVEHPSVRQISLAEGLRASNRQWLAAQRRSSNEF